MGWTEPINKNTVDVIQLEIHKYCEVQYGREHAGLLFTALERGNVLMKEGNITMWITMQIQKGDDFFT